MLLSLANVVFVGIYSCMYVCASMCRLCISIWYMYVEITFVFKNQYNMNRKFKTLIGMII